MRTPAGRAMRARLEAMLQSCWWQPAPNALAWALGPLSWVYRGLLALHGRRAAQPVALPVPVLVVGNHVVGGAGKTPTVIALVQALQAAGHHPGVISRGHGREGAEAVAVTDASTAAAVGDEPLLIRRRCGVPVWVGRQRPEVALQLCAAHPEVDVLVADDGLQHRALARQAEVVVFDERGAGNGLLLPAGPLREPLPTNVPAMRRVLYTAGAASTRLPGVMATRRLGLAWPLAAWQRGDATQTLPLQQLRGRPLLAAAGMAAPEKFFTMLAAAGLRFERLPLPDHHSYTTLPWPADTPELLVTEKDAVKLQPEAVGSARVWVLPLDLQLPAGLVDELSTLLFPPPPLRPAAP